jgi:calcium/calmodulin-dependent protein kinase I
VNPDKRMIAKEALEHPWMATTQTVDLLPNVRKNFNAKMTLKKAILAVAALNKVSSMSKSNLQQ